MAPGQVAKWEKNGDWFGYCTFFKSEFLQYNSEINFLQQYPFFNIQEANLIPVSQEQFKSLSPNYAQILHEQKDGAAYSVEIIRSSFQAILWQVRRIYESAKIKTVVEKANAIIASQFQYMVNEYFIDKTTVEEYADMLNITANHLSQTIKNTTGKTAKNIISQRRLEEAKYLLNYTNNDIAEIAYHLNFSAPTHFTKFFKKETACTPQEYRTNSK
ncbi:MAG: helix-turn-helix transcriptional regulator [Bacteroidetes bacterium]|nr:helix-turn-helix transcriptional regulator [Bacteroidota bacterium]